jgi:hypothetical protein
MYSELPLLVWLHILTSLAIKHVTLFQRSIVHESCSICVFTYVYFAFMHHVLQVTPYTILAV